MTYTLWNKNTNAPALDDRGRAIEGRPGMGTTDGNPPERLAGELAWLAEEDPGDPPAYDPDTQRVTRQWGAVTIDPGDPRIGTRARSWVVVDLTAEEVAAIAERKARAAKLGNLTPAAVDWLRQRAENARAVTVTTGNAVAVLQAVMDDLGVFFDRFADLIEGQGIDLEG